jgi:hypothetical protein
MTGAADDQGRDQRPDSVRLGTEERISRLVADISWGWVGIARPIDRQSHRGDLLDGTAREAPAQAKLHSARRCARPRLHSGSLRQFLP